MSDTSTSGNAGNQAWSQTGSQTGRIRTRLAELGLSLPPPVTPAGNYVPVVITGNLLFIAGQIPMIAGKPQFTGRVGHEVTLEQARQCARTCALNGLAAAELALGSLDRIERIVRLGVFVACEHTFGDHPEVANGASDLLGEIFGPAGRHVRAAVGAPCLPRQVPVEIEFVMQIVLS